MKIVIVGSGVAGTRIAASCLERGYEVTMLERGPRVAMRDSRAWLDFVTTGVRPYDKCDARGCDLAGNVNRNAKVEAEGFTIQGGRLFAVGGSLLHWGGWTPRMQPEDFEYRRNTGTGADWPIGYAELEPYYSRAERFLNVSGPKTPRPHHPNPWRKEPYPYFTPPFPSELDRLRRGFDENGVTYDHVPVSRRGLEGTVGGPCMTYGTCKYCPMGARFDPTLLLDAWSQRAGFTLLNDTLTTRVQVKNRIAIGVEYERSGGNHTLAGDVIVLAAGTLESARLLFASLPTPPRWLGRGLTSHAMIQLAGTRPHSEASRSVPIPAFHSRQFDTPEDQRHGKVMITEYPKEGALTEWFGGKVDPKELRQRALADTFQLRAFIEEVPQFESRIEFVPGDDRIKHVSYVTAPEFVKRRAWVLEKFKTLLSAAGCTEFEPAIFTRRADHSAGIVRLARDAENGVVDPSHQVFGIRNLYAITNGNMPNTGVANPTLTLVALTERWCDLVLPTM